MTAERYHKIALPLTAAGILFAGYMSGVKLFSGTCAFNESCPTLAGLPACVYGFVIFLSMFVVSLMAFRRKSRLLGPVRQNLILSALGVLFAGSFVPGEIMTIVRDGQRYMLGLPTCAYGLVFFLIIFVLTASAYRSNRKAAVQSDNQETKA